jgi:uncharacterized protein (TIGR03435 family)
VTNVLFLAIKDHGLLAQHVSQPGKKSYQLSGETPRWVNSPIASVARFLEVQAFNLPVVVQAGLDDRYDITFQVEPADGAPAQNVQVRRQQAAVQGLARAGLELVPTNLPIEMLVVDRVK